MTCMAKLKEGKTFQLEEGILDEEKHSKSGNTHLSVLSPIPKSRY